MLRSVEVAVPPERTEELIAAIRGLPGLIGLQVQRGAGVEPPGDIVRANVTSQALHQLMRRLEARGIPADAATGINSTQLLGSVRNPHNRSIVRGAADQTWEEIELSIAHESNMTLNALLLMTISGVLATIGIWTNTLHYVVAAMLIAPGFEPAVRVALGAIGRSAAWRRGLSDLGLGYLAVAIGAGLTTLVLLVLDDTPLGAEPSYLVPNSLVVYWTMITGKGLVVAFAAGVAGALLVATGRSVLTAGVMVALSLVPSAALVGIGIASLDVGLLADGAMRWALEVILVLIASLVVFDWKRRSLYRRDAWL